RETVMTDVRMGWLKGSAYKLLLSAALIATTAPTAWAELFLVKDINTTTTVTPFPSSPAYLTSAGGTLFFTASDAATGNELWKSDGTAAGTMLVKDINPGAASSGPASLTDVNG